MEITKQSPVSGNFNTMDLDITEAAIGAWRAGMLIQDAMPNLTADEREFIMTGLHGDEYTNVLEEEAYCYGEISS
tara:strand:+ start:273 stop:497 length:225 start_codon:yes stop_codon:yes gene_type:complete